MAAVGHGGIKEGQVVNKLIEEYNKDHTEQPDDKEILEAYALKRAPHSSHGQGGIIVKGADDVAVRFSKCCSPVPVMRSSDLSPEDEASRSIVQTVLMCSV